MGNIQGSVSKEDYEKHKEYALKQCKTYGEKAHKNYEIYRKVTLDRVEEAKVQYAPQLEQAKIRYDQAKLKVKGYGPPTELDNSNMVMITNFERKRMPFWTVDIDEFERRVKKLAEP